jgi:hypothetical protein
VYSAEQPFASSQCQGAGPMAAFGFFWLIVAN